MLDGKNILRYNRRIEMRYALCNFGGDALSVCLRRSFLFLMPILNADLSYLARSLFYGENRVINVVVLLTAIFLFAII
jgi:hypothetical protein